MIKNKAAGICLALSMVVAIACPNILTAQISSYSQNFEGLNINDTSTVPLGVNEGWLVGANVFEPTMGGFLYDYFAFPAPNDGQAFTAIASGAGGPNQGDQYLNVFSDYLNADHGNGNIIDTYAFREEVIGMDDVGATYEFSFDYRRADAPYGPADSMTTAAYYRVLTPAPDFFLVEEGFLNTTDATTDWTEGATISITINPKWVGTLIQYGFNTNGTNFDASGVYYDNVSFAIPGEGCDDELGDINGDDVVNLLDIQPFVNLIATASFQCEADINEDGMVDLLDVNGFVFLLSGG